MNSIFEFTAIESTLWLLVDMIAKGTALLCLACIAALLLRRSSAALRHSVWSLTMLSLLLLPIASAMLPAWRIPILQAKSKSQSSADVGASTETSRFAKALETASTQRPFSHVDDQERSTTEPAFVTNEASDSSPILVSRPPATGEFDLAKVSGAGTSGSPNRTSLLAVSIWVAGVILSVALLLLGFRRTTQLRRSARLIEDGSWHRLLEEARCRLGLRRDVELRECAASIVPLTCGVIVPAVVLPLRGRDWDDSMKRTVLLHELAHIRRGDVATQVIGRIACTLYWFHPLAWYALGRLRHERELACDDAVVGSGEKASEYAGQLLEVARLCTAPKGLSWEVAMAEKNSLELRVKSLFDMARSHRPVARAAAIVTVLFSGLVMVTIARLHPSESIAAAVVNDHLSSAPENGPSEARESEVAKAKETEVETLATLAKAGDKLPANWTKGPATLKRIRDIRPEFGPVKRGLKLGLADPKTSASQPLSDRLPLEMFLFNVGREDVSFRFMLDFTGEPPMLLNSRRERVGVTFVKTGYRFPIHRMTLKPGEACSFPTLGLGLNKEATAPSMVFPTMELPDVGVYHLSYNLKIQYETKPQENAQKPVQERLKSGGVTYQIKKLDSGETKLFMLSPRYRGIVSKERLASLQPEFGPPQKGLQMGLAITNQQRVFPTGDHISMELLFRNVSEREINFDFQPDFNWSPPNVTDTNGKAIQVRPNMVWLLLLGQEVTLQPGEVFGIRTPDLGVNRERAPLSLVSAAPGKYQATFTRRVSERTSDNTVGWAKSLTTAPLTFEVGPSPGGATGISLGRKPQD